MKFSTVDFYEFTVQIEVLYKIPVPIYHLSVIVRSGMN
jgi:hypothetical protein